MGFSGVRAVILIVVLFGSIVAVSKLGLPGWIVPVALLLTAAVLKGSEKKAEKKASV